MSEPQRKVSADEARDRLTPDLALLLDAMRSEMDSKLDAMYFKLLTRLLAMGIPLGAVGGFVAEMLRPGTTAQALGYLPFL